MSNRYPSDKELVRGKGRANAIPIDDIGKNEYGVHPFPEDYYPFPEGYHPSPGQKRDDKALPLLRDNKVREQILQFIRERKRVTRKDIQVQYNLAYTTVTQHLRTLVRYRLVGRHQLTHRGVVTFYPLEVKTKDG